MYKKILFGSIAILFAAASAFNIGLIQTKDAGDISLDAIAIMAQAHNGETAYDAFIQSIKDWWNSEIYDCRVVECLIDHVPFHGPVYGEQTICVGGSTKAHCTSCFSFCL